MNDMFAAEEASPVNKGALYKQNKEVQLMERLERRMEGNYRQTPLMLLHAQHTYLPPSLYHAHMKSAGHNCLLLPWHTVGLRPHSICKCIVQTCHCESQHLQYHHVAETGEHFVTQHSWPC